MKSIHTALGVIPARGGSKGVLRKNIRLLAGQPLIAYTLRAAQESRLLTEYVVSTDDSEIACVVRSMNADVNMRPAELAGDTVPTVPVVLYVVEAFRELGKEFDFIVLLQPTSPLRIAQDIDTCLEMLSGSDADAVVSVAEVPKHYHPDWQFDIVDGMLRPSNGERMEHLVPRRQLLSETYTRNGAVYVIRTSVLLQKRELVTSNTLAYVMPDCRSANIDSETDLAIAEYYLRTPTK